MAMVVADNVAQFRDEGYVVIEDVFDPTTDFAPIYAEWEAILGDIADGLVARGKLSSHYEGLPFDRRLTAICSETDENIFQPFDISLPQKDIRFDTPVHVSQAVFDLLVHERLLDAVEELIGPEIVSNPVQHVRMKPPSKALSEAAQASYQAAKVPWHQDQGVLLEEADEATILSCWVAVTDADENNGCMQVVPRSNRQDLYHHCPGDPQMGIPEKLLPLDGAIALPMRAGSALFFGQRLVHGSLDNTTEDQVRISMDLRYQPAGEPSGRPDFPSFLARSREHPDRVLRDAGVWTGMWLAARSRLAAEGLPKFNRWDTDSPLCA